MLEEIPTPKGSQGAVLRQHAQQKMLHKLLYGESKMPTKGQFRDPGEAFTK